MVMTSDETQIQIFANWPMSHAKRVTRDNRKNPEYHIVAAIGKLWTDKNCPAGKSWPNHVKNEQHIGSEKTYSPQKTGQFNIMVQRTANENAACLRGICKRSDQAASAETSHAFQVFKIVFVENQMFYHNCC